MLIYSMSVSVDGFIADRDGALGWTAPDEEQFRFHLAQTREFGGYLCGRRLYETMLPWETDPSMRDNELGAAVADVWCALPKVVFSRTLDSVQGNAPLAEASVAEEAAAALDATDKDVSIGGARLAAAPPHFSGSENAQSIQNSLPSMSCIGMHESLPSYRVCTCTAPSGTSRAHSASSAASRSSPTSPVPTRTSRCTRFLTTLPSGTRWKNRRGPTPDGSLQANHASRCSGGCELLKSSQVANPSGGGGTTYPNTSHQKRARRSGSAQSKVTWNCLIDDISAP